jgi:hypothetical protein
MLWLSSLLCACVCKCVRKFDNNLMIHQFLLCLQPAQRKSAATAETVTPAGRKRKRKDSEQSVY